MFKWLEFKDSFENSKAGDSCCVQGVFRKIKTQLFTRNQVNKSTVDSDTEGAKLGVDVNQEFYIL